jgi:hypothetical protein
VTHSIANVEAVESRRQCSGSFKTVPDNDVHKGTADCGDCARCSVCSQEVPVWFAESWSLMGHLVPEAA